MAAENIGIPSSADKISVIEVADPDLDTYLSDARTSVVDQATSNLSSPPRTEGLPCVASTDAGLHRGDIVLLIAFCPFDAVRAALVVHWV
jgi:hypothetical protein